MTDIFSGMTNDEIATAVGDEMIRRRLVGVLFMCPSRGRIASFTGLVPSGFDDLKISEALEFFAELAASATKTTIDPGPGNGWVN